MIPRSALASMYFLAMTLLNATQQNWLEGNSFKHGNPTRNNQLISVSSDSVINAGMRRMSVVGAAGLVCCGIVAQTRLKLSGWKWYISIEAAARKRILDGTCEIWQWLWEMVRDTNAISVKEIFRDILKIIFSYV